MILGYSLQSVRSAVPRAIVSLAAKYEPQVLKAIALAAAPFPLSDMELVIAVVWGGASIRPYTLKKQQKCDKLCFEQHFSDRK